VVLPDALDALDREDLDLARRLLLRNLRGAPVPGELRISVIVTGRFGLS